MSKIYLVRHAKAGERRTWSGDDIDRPLSKKGWRQSELLAKRLAKLSPTVLYSSPYVRCVQTLEPLGKRAKLDVEVEQRLCEYEPAAPVIELIAQSPKNAVLCSHGDIIPATIAAIKRSGAKINSPKDWRKASVWVLKRNKHGRVVSAAVWPPPVV